MAITTIKSTYALDVETVRALEAMAQRWKTSKSEALRRAIRAAAGREGAHVSDAVRALDELQGSLRLSSAAAKGWQRSARSERRAADARRGRAGR